MNNKIIAHIKGILDDTSLLQEGFFMLAYVSGSSRGLGSGYYTWLAIETNMLNRWDNVTYKDPNEAKQALIDYFGAENVIFEPFTGIEVY